MAIDGAYLLCWPTLPTVRIIRFMKTLREWATGDDEPPWNRSASDAASGWLTQGLDRDGELSLEKDTHGRWVRIPSGTMGKSMLEEPPSACHDWKRYWSSE